MLWPGHLAFGYLVTKLLLLAAPISFSSQEMRLLLIGGMIASVLPDIDIIPFFFKHRSLTFQKDESHRKVWSHTPLIWAMVFLLLAFFVSSPFFAFVALVMLVGSLSHFLGDSIEYGVFWLWPFSKKRIALHTAFRNDSFFEKDSPIAHYGYFFKTVYIKNWTFWVELILIFTALFVAFGV